MLLAKKWNTLLPMGVFTQHCKQHQRICMQTCIRVLYELGLRLLCCEKGPSTSLLNFCSCKSCSFQVTHFVCFCSQGIKMESFPKCDFIPVDYQEVRHVKSSFKKLMRACVPSSPFNENERGFLKAMEETEWLPQVRSNKLRVSQQMRSGLGCDESNRKESLIRKHWMPTTKSVK